MARQSTAPVTDLTRSSLTDELLSTSFFVAPSPGHAPVQTVHCSATATVQEMQPSIEDLGYCRSSSASSVKLLEAKAALSTADLNFINPKVI
eukprot:8000557-Heterocapsa_arctica.AAC.1